MLTSRRQRCCRAEVEQEDAVFDPRVDEADGAGELNAEFFEQAGEIQHAAGRLGTFAGRIGVLDARRRRFEPDPVRVAVVEHEKGEWPAQGLHRHAADPQTALSRQRDTHFLPRAASAVTRQYFPLGA